MAGADLPFACTCGTLRGTLLGVSPQNGTRAECFCNDCRAAEVFAGGPDPAPAAVQLYQTLPCRVRIDEGEDQLAVFAFGTRGPLRWYAKCCGATLCLTARSPKVSFASFRTDRLSDPKALDPIRARAFVRKANGKRGHDGLAGFLWGFATRTLAALMSGQWKDTPFFDATTGTPVRDVHVVTASERAALRLPKV